MRRTWRASPHCHHMYPAGAPFGGYKASGVGRETHKMMVDHDTQTKDLFVSYDPRAQGFFQDGADPMEQDRVSATPAALEVIERLSNAYGPLVFLQSGGCCGGSSPLCMRRGELFLGPGDVLLGAVGPASFFVDHDLDERWGRPRYVIDVSAGAGDTFSLEGREDLHFILAE